jgi:hypothetical protein
MFTDNLGMFSGLNTAINTFNFQKASDFQALQEGISGYLFTLEIPLYLKLIIAVRKGWASLPQQD